ncbi:MAG: pyridoxal-dependent decarboxylase [Verrucomicrobiae bacterium]|nr:pyridoxal-dependent decarboxylase [Verrucomicrobiae bacterium]
MPDSASLKALFDPQSFRAEGHKLIDLLADSLQHSLAGEGNARTSQQPNQSAAHWRDHLQAALAGNAAPTAASELFSQWIGQSIKTHHPHTMGHQVGVTAPIAALADLLGSLLDTGNGVFEVGDPATAVERAVVMDLARRLNMGENAGGYLTSGGTLGNLTALLAARQAAAPFDAWKHGNDNTRPFGVLVSEQAHYCIDRAARVMGWGERGVIKVRTDAQSRMQTGAMQEALDSTRAEGIQVIAAVGNAGTTATGAFDPLDEIAEFCRVNGLWFHADAAHGGAVVFSPKYRHLLKGIEYADSIVIDFHKLMMSPSLTTAVLFKREATSFGAFAQEAKYLWRTKDPISVGGDALPWFDAAHRTMECTRPMAALRVFALLANHGDKAIANYVESVFAAAQEFAKIIQTTPGFELLTPPTANIICYRIAPPELTDAESDALNTAVRTQLISEGNFYIVETKIADRTWLRSAIMNPFTSGEHFRSLLETLLRIREEINI